MTQCEPMRVPSPMRTCAATIVNGPISTVAARSADASTIAVGWMRATLRLQGTRRIAHIISASAASSSPTIARPAKRCTPWRNRSSVISSRN